MKTLLMKVVAGTVVLFSVASAQGATIFMDAAELDIYGNPLAYPSVRMRVDNTAAPQAAFADVSYAVTDLTGISFEFNYTGTLLGAHVYNATDPNSPWYGADVAPMVQTVGNYEYMAGSYWTADNVIHPAWSRKGLTTGATEILEDIVPAGLLWEPALKLIGWDQDPVVLFHSPATGTVDSNEGTWALSDDDRRPQTAIPEPATLGLLGFGALTLLRRRRG